jgi:hypothetical protein
MREPLQAKLDKTLVPEVTFVVGPKTFNKPMNKPHKNHKFCKKKDDRKSKHFHDKSHYPNIICHY